jgi:signal transduction histidine kinase
MTAEATEKPDLAALLARLDDLRQAERRAASARMVSVAGHLVGTPLNVIAGRAALIRSNLAPEAVEENVRRIEEQVERLALRIRRLIDYFGLAEPSRARRSVGEILEECHALYGPIAGLKGVTLVISGHQCEPLRIEAEISPLILTTLLSLGVRTSVAGQTISLTVTEHGPKTVLFELQLPGLEVPKNFERLEPPEHGIRYDPGTLEAFWTCLGLARRLGGALHVVEAPSGVGVAVRFECDHV